MHNDGLLLDLYRYKIGKCGAIGGCGGSEALKIGIYVFKHGDVFCDGTFFVSESIASSEAFVHHFCNPKSFVGSCEIGFEFGLYFYSCFLVLIVYIHVEPPCVGNILR